jgi:alanyl-tRNA synthetase
VKAETIRNRFLKFFESRGHRVVGSHSLLPAGDQTLLFVNAGMVQFKDVFTGQRDPGYERAATTQKCLRVSGKHNDLDEVGRTPRHHTFFEMLGNFSFGDYFKRDAVLYAWELLVGEFGLDPADLWVTVHPDDAEARELWEGVVGVDPSRILADPSNFWSMGETGPCGPCSEIHIDRGPSFPGVSMEDPGHRFMELWNLVFMQYDRDSEGKLTPLPAPSIDTGMGLERIASVLQGVRSNYDTDLFMPLIERMAAIAGARYGQDDETDTALRVVADHARATAFLICDGVYPENEGRGYVLRRLMRRALRFGHKLGVRGPFFTRICLEVRAAMGAAWPELEAAAPIIERVAGQEEERFLRTLSSGLDLLENAIRIARDKGDSTLDGDTIFALYDTHGFPVDLTEVVAGEHGLALDQAGFETRMEAQRARGRASWKTHSEDLKEVLDACAEKGLKSSFTGYSDESGTSRILAIFAGGMPVEQAGPGTTVIVVTAETPFYGESGGQVGDTGVIEGAGVHVKVAEARRPREDLVLHIGEVHGEQSLRTGQDVRLIVDEGRARTRRNHSATHLLHRALREVLGGHVRQRGSLVAPDRLRFDFSHSAPVSDEELALIEDRVIEWIFRDDPVETDVLPQDEAVARGALHFFGDKYGDVVRMVTMGGSRELCGGTHVSRTGDIGLFKIVSEAGISAGVRRIEALTGEAALTHLRAQDRVVQELSRLLRIDGQGLADRVRKMQADDKALRRELAEAQVKAASGAGGGDGGVVHEVNGVRILVASAEGMDPKAARDLADVLRGKVGSGLVLLTRSEGEKLMVILAGTRDVSESRPANRLLQVILEPMGGRGGGNPMLAQGSASGPIEPGRVLDALMDALR